MEVLSESTERFDRGDKFEEYSNMISLEEYVLISQDKLQIQRFTLQAEDHGDMRIFKDSAGDFRLQAVQEAIPINHIYDGMDFDQGEQQSADMAIPLTPLVPHHATSCQRFGPDWSSSI
jgi:hypothetical protein